AAVAFAGARFDLMLQRRPRGKAVFTRQDELGVVECQRDGGDLAIARAGEPRMVRAHALQRGGLARLCGPQQLTRLRLLLREIRVRRQGSRRIGGERHDDLLQLGLASAWQAERGTSSNRRENYRWARPFPRTGRVLNAHA